MRLVTLGSQQPCRRDGGNIGRAGIAAAGRGVLRGLPDVRPEATD